MIQDQPDHSPWYQPRTAEIISRGGEGFANSIGQGLQQLANGLAMGLEKRREETKRINTLAKNAEGMYLSSPELQKKLGLSPDEFKALAATDKTSRVYGAVESQGYERRNAELKQFAAQIAASEQKTAQDAEAMKALSQFQTSYRNVTTPLQIPAGTFGMQVSGGRVAPSPAETVGGQPMDERGIFDLGMKSRLNPNQLGDVLKAYGGGDGAPFYNRGDVGNLLPVKGAPGYGIAVTGPRQSQVIFTGGPQGSSINVPGVGDVGVITTKPGQSQIVPGQQTQGQIREALAKAEADIAKLRTKMKADPEMEQYLGGALAEQESLANSYRTALGTASPSGNRGQGKAAPAVGTVMGGYRFKGGNPNDKANWEVVN